MAEKSMSPGGGVGNGQSHEPIKPERKIDRLRAAMDAEDWQAAISIAAKFPRLGAEKEAITRAHNAYQNPEFYRQIGHDPKLLIVEGIAALQCRYGARP